jgi:two-component system, response regulator / RNA-binding antiterminator
MTSSALSVLVIDENGVRASIIEAGLREAGHDEVTVIQDVTGIARRIAELNPDVIVIEIPIGTCWRICSSSRAP